MDECAVTVTAAAFPVSLLLVLVVADVSSELDGGTVRKAVDEATVAVTTPAFSPPSVVDDAVDAGDCVAVAFAVVELALETSLGVAPGTAPNTLTTLLSAKHPICTPLVVLRGIAAQIAPEPHPTTPHWPALVQPAYSPSIQAYWPSLQASDAVRAAKSALRPFAWARLEA